MTLHTFPIVGCHFHPPAKALLQVLPGSAPLTLIPEPSNPYDPNAVAVFVEPRYIPPSQYDELSTLVAGWGFTIEEIMETPAFHLGYIPAKLAAVTIDRIKERLSAEGLEHLEGTLAFGPKGAALVAFDIPSSHSDSGSVV